MRSIKKRQGLAVCPLQYVFTTDVKETAAHCEAILTAEASKRFRALVLTAMALLLFVLGANAANNWYVRPGGSGSKTGGNWDNAWDSGGIGWGSVNGGDTIWMAGGTYASQIVPANSGSAGNYIYEIGRAACRE